MDKRFSLKLIKRLVRMVVKILHMGSIDSLDRLHVYLRHKNYFCHITFVGYGRATYNEGGLFVELFEQMKNGAIRSFIPLQIPIAVSTRELDNLHRLCFNAIYDLVRKVIGVLKFGVVIPRELFIRV